MRDEITLSVERDVESGWLVASWDAPGDGGGITTQGQDLRELQDNIREAVRCHFGTGEAPRAIRLHFVSDPGPLKRQSLRPLSASLRR